MKKRLEQWFCYTLAAILLLTTLAPIILTSTAYAVPSDFTASYQDEATIVLNGGGWGGAPITAISSTRYEHDTASFAPSDSEICVIRVEIVIDSGDPSTGTLSLHQPNTLDTTVNICNIDDMEGWSASQSITIENSEIFDDNPDTTNRIVNVCVHVLIDRRGPFASARVSEFVPEHDTIRLLQDGREVARKQGRLTNGNSRTDDYANYCAQFTDIPVGNYTATSRLGEASTNFRKRPGIAATVRIEGENEPYTLGVDDDEADDDNKICEQEIKVTGGWIICMIIDSVDKLADKWIDKVDELLSVGGDEYNTDEFRKAWSYFRNIASLLLMAIGLVMIIGQSISKE